MSTVTVDDNFRRIIAWYQSTRKGNPRKHRLATRFEVRRWFENYGRSMDMDADAEFQQAIQDWEETEND